MNKERSVVSRNLLRKVITFTILAGALASSPPISAQTRLVTRRDPGNPANALDFQDSASSSISADGRFALFTSTARNLVLGDNNQFGANVFLRDRTSNTTTLVSINLAGTGGGNGQSSGGILSTNGRYVLFESDAGDLVSGDTNGVNDIFVRDLVAGTTALVSVATNGLAGNGRSADAVMTPDGRYVAFISYASNLVAGDTNGLPDVFVRDLVSQTTTLASVGAFLPSVGAGQVVAATPLISADGRYVTFFSSAQGLVPGTTTYPGDIFRRDLVAGSTAWVSTNLSTTQTPTNQPSFHPAMSSDGRFIAFKYGPTNTAINSLSPSIFLWDSTAGLNILVASSAYALGGAAADDAYGPVITPDGRFIAYVTNVTGTTPNQTAIRVYDSQTGSNTLASVDRVGNLPSALSDTPVITSDGHFLAFLSSGTNLADNTTSALPGTGMYLYLRDLQAGTNFLVDVHSDPTAPPLVDGMVPSVSSDGRFVAFGGAGGGIVSNFSYTSYEAYVRDMSLQTYDWISTRNSSVASLSANRFSYMSQVSLTQDGRRIAFTSTASDLVTNDFNSTYDVYVRDIPSGSNILVSVGNTGNAADGGTSYNPVISADGRYVAFISCATNLLSSNLNNVAPNVYLRDLQIGTTILVSPNYHSGPSFTGGKVFGPTISQDGRYIAYLNFNVSGFASPSLAYSLLRFDALTGQTNSITNNVWDTGSIGSLVAPSMSADGRYVAYTDRNLHPFVWDSQFAQNIYTNVSTVAKSLAMSPNAARLAISTGAGFTVAELSNTSISYTSGGGIFTPLLNNCVWSTDGRFLAFATSPPSQTGTNAILLHDFQSSTDILVSATSNLTGAAVGSADSPAISGDGRFVVYRHTATTIVPLPSTNTPNLYLFDCLAGLNTLLTPAPGQPIGPSKPAINGDGHVVVFSSFLASQSLDLDLNRTVDLFASSLLPWGAADTDGDGIPDQWTSHYFSHATGQAGDHSLANDDPDGDEMSNLQEFLAGTDPNNAASVLRLQIVPVVAQNSVQLNWTAVPGKPYKVQFKDDLAGSWQDAPGRITVVGTQASISIQAGVSTRFYRAVVLN